MSDTERVINDLNVAKLILCNPQMLTPEMCVRIGQAVTNAIGLLKEQDTMIREFEHLVKERTAIKKMLDDWTARQTEAEGEDGNA